MIFLDFDGVLVDSNAETIKNFFYAIEATFNSPISNKDKKIIKDQILLVRGKIGPIRDFFLEYKRIIKDDNRLKDYDPKIIDTKLNLLVKNFLKNRSQSKLKNLEAWEDLHKPTKIVKTLQKINRLACILPGIQHYILCARVMAVCLNDCDMVVFRFEILVVK